MDEAAPFHSAPRRLCAVVIHGRGEVLVRGAVGAGGQERSTSICAALFIFAIKGRLLGVEGCIGFDSQGKVAVLPTCSESWVRLYFPAHLQSGLHCHEQMGRRRCAVWVWILARNPHGCDSVLETLTWSLDSSSFANVKEGWLIRAGVRLSGGTGGMNRATHRQALTSFLTQLAASNGWELAP